MKRSELRREFARIERGFSARPPLGLRETEIMFDNVKQHGAEQKSRHAYSDFAERHIVPIMFVVGYLGGWLGCSVWYGAGWFGWLYR